MEIDYEKAYYEMLNNLTSTQERCNELLAENRSLKRERASVEMTLARAILRAHDTK